MQAFRNAPIRTKLTLLLVGTVGLALLFSFAAFVVNDVSVMERAMQSHFSTLADVLGANCTAALDFNVPSGAQDVLKSLRLEPNVVQACVYDNAGARFADFPDPPSSAFPSSPPVSGGEMAYVRDGYLHVFRPIDHNDQRVGTVYLQVSRDPIYSQLRTYAVVVFGVFSVTLIAMVLVASRLQRIISRPLLRLVDAAKTVSAEGDYATRVEKENDDELGTLVDAFNLMLTQIEQRDVELAKHHAHLEELVQDRTQSLEDRTLELARSNVELARSNQELQQFAFISSHDLQEPLRKIQAFGDLLQAKYNEAIDDQGRDYIKRMQNAAGRMRALIDGLLSFSRVTTKGQPFQSVDLSEVLTNVITDLESRIEQSGGHIEADELPTIDADALQMRQLLQNLIGNGLKYHRPDVPPSIHVEARILTNGAAPRLPGLTRDEVCEITVRDNGIGFEEKYVERIFAPFQRLHGRDEYEGTGMGLAICRKIVERHHGAITASGDPGMGACFTILLPIRQAQGDESE